MSNPIPANSSPSIANPVGDPMGHSQSVVETKPQVKGKSKDFIPEPVKQVGAYLISKEGYPVSIGIIAFLFLFQHLLRVLPEYWFDKDSYYSHGPLVPFLAAYIIFERSDKLKQALVTQPRIQKLWAWASAIALAPLAYIAYIASVTDLLTILSIIFVLISILLSIIFFDYKKTLVALPGLMYMFFAFPIGRGKLDYWTNSLQHYSTSLAVHLLIWSGFHPYQANVNQIYIGHYSLYVAAACAGMGLALSVVAFAVLFCLIARLNVFKSAIMILASLVIVIPINAFRIALIAVVGDRMGDSAAAHFHDWSGYLSLVILFLILMKFTRLLGWK